MRSTVRIECAFAHLAPARTRSAGAAALVRLAADSRQPMSFFLIVKELVNELSAIGYPLSAKRPSAF
jgi:hypothetical protein